MALAVVLPAMPGQVVVRGRMRCSFVQSAVAGEVVVRGIVIGPVIGRVADLGRSGTAVVVRTIMDAMHPGKGNPPFQAVETEAASAILSAGLHREFLSCERGDGDFDLRREER